MSDQPEDNKTISRRTPLGGLLQLLEYATLPERGYIPTLDGWRALAFSCVLLSHAFNKLLKREHASRWLTAPVEHAGSAGVLIFFAISGFLICSRLLVSMSGKSPSSVLKNFYIRRFFRIQPPALVYLSILAFAGAFGFYSAYSQEFWRGWLAALFFMRNYIPGSEETNHFWSLAVEEQFYFVWPILLVLLKPRKAALFAVCGALAAPIARYIELTQWHTALSINEILQRTECRMDSFLIPCLLAILLSQEEWRKRLAPILEPRMQAITIGLLVSIAALPFRFPQLTLFQKQVTPVLISLLVIGTTGNQGLLARALEWNLLRIIGRLSYSLYLWQQIVMLRPMMEATGAQVSRELLLRFTETILLAIASYKFIEVPLIARGRSIAERSIVNGTRCDTVTIS